MSIISDNSSMESLNPKYKCKGCSKVLSVNSIMKHIVNKPDCLNLYSQKDLDEQKRLCKDHLRNKRIQSNKQYYKMLAFKTYPCTLLGFQNFQNCFKIWFFL